MIVAGRIAPALLVIVVSTACTGDRAAPNRKPAEPTMSATPNVPATIADDCSVDVTSDIQAWLNSLADGIAGASTLARFGSEKCYLVNGTLTLANRSWLTVDGQGSEFRASERGALVGVHPHSERKHWKVVGGHDLRLHRMVIKSTNTVSDLPGKAEWGSYEAAYETEHGLEIQGSDRVAVQDWTIDGVWGDGVLVRSIVGGATSTHIALSDITVDRNGRQGVAVTDVEGLTATGVRILHGRRGGFDLEPGNGAVFDVDISRSTICTQLIPFASGGNGEVSRITIHDNNITCPGGRWLWADSSQSAPRNDWHVHHNASVELSGSSLAGATFVDAMNVNVHDNVIPMHSGSSSSRNAVKFAMARGDLEVKNNRFNGADRSYTIDGVADGPGVDACGNTNSVGSDQPMPC